MVALMTSIVCKRKEFVVDYYFYLLEIYTYSVTIVFPLTMTAYVVSACFHEYKTKDLMLSLFSLVICLFALIGMMQLAVVLTDAFELSLTALDSIWFVISIFLYWLIYKVSGFAHPIKRTLSVVGFAMLFLIVGSVLQAFIEILIPVNIVTILILLLLALYPAALIFTRSPNDYNSNEIAMDLPDMESLPQQQEVGIPTEEPPLRYRQVPQSQSGTYLGCMEHPEYPID